MDNLMNRLERLSVAIGELNPVMSAPPSPTTTMTTTAAAGPAKPSEARDPFYETPFRPKTSFLAHFYPQISDKLPYKTKKN
jgi:hypothetical protein